MEWDEPNSVCFKGLIFKSSFAPTFTALLTPKQLVTSVSLDCEMIVRQIAKTLILLN